MHPVSNDNGEFSAWLSGCLGNKKFSVSMMNWISGGCVEKPHKLLLIVSVSMEAYMNPSYFLRTTLPVSLNCSNQHLMDFPSYYRQ
jgi:hypothetical protein